MYNALPACFYYMAVETSFVGIESGPLRSPFRLRPGPLVEERTYDMLATILAIHGPFRRKGHRISL
jgi:hypothetical protein